MARLGVRGLERLRKTIFFPTTSTKLFWISSVRTDSGVIRFEANLTSDCRKCHMRGKRELATQVSQVQCVNVIITKRNSDLQ